MPDCMMPFPEDWHDFLKDYSFDDSQEVYTNGSRLIPVFRVEQLIKHLLKAQDAVEPKLVGVNTWSCSECGVLLGWEEFTPSGMELVEYKFCPNCGRKVKWG